jgi:hypothetical protein
MLSHFIGKVAEDIKRGNRLNDKTIPQYHFFIDFMKTITIRGRELDMLERYQKILEENIGFSKKVDGFYADLQAIERKVEERMAGRHKELCGYALFKSGENKLFRVIEKKKYSGEANFILIQKNERIGSGMRKSGFM